MFEHRWETPKSKLFLRAPEAPSLSTKFEVCDRRCRGQWDGQRHAHRSHGIHSSGGPPKQKGRTAHSTERPQVAINAQPVCPRALAHPKCGAGRGALHAHTHTGITIKTTVTNKARTEAWTASGGDAHTNTHAWP